MARRITYLHPDEACARLGLVPRPGEGKWAKYDRRRALSVLTQYTGPFMGFRYDEAEVEALAEQLIKKVKKAA